MKKRLTLIQMDVHVNDVEYNYNRVQELLSQSLSENPDIIILPETWNTGFYPSRELINISDKNGERTKSLLSTFAKKHNVNIEEYLAKVYLKMVEHSAKIKIEIADQKRYISDEIPDEVLEEMMPWNFAKS